jgi:hypothetical protein
MDTNILLYGLIFLIGFVLGHILWPSKKNEYIETYNREGNHQNNGSGSYGRNEESDNEDDDDDDEYEEDDNGRFYFIDNDDLPEEWNMFDIIVDKETRVQYLQDEEGYSLTPLINSEGKPILYTGDFDEYDE